MNRPSLYAAFGDKEAMYATAIDDYVARMWAQVGAALALPTLREALGEFYRRAIAMYLSGDEGPRGCLIACVALVEAPMHPAVGARVKATLDEIDAALERRVEAARHAGEVGVSARPAELAVFAAATLHSLAVRARAGASRATLARQAAAAVDLICGRSP